MNENPDKKSRILIVEDENDLRLLYTEVLTDAGYEVDQAPDGTIGMEKALKGNWDALLLDIMLPGNDGLNILKKIKENEAKRGPILMLTNLNSEHIITEAFNIGADGYLIKSEITPDKVISEIQAFLK